MKKLALTLILICSANIIFSQTFPVTGDITTTNGVGLNIVDEYLTDMNSKDQTKYVKINTNVPFQLGQGMTSFYIDYWGYDQAWRMMVGFYVYNNSFESPSLSILGEYSHDKVVLSNENGHVCISIPLPAFSHFGRITVNSLTAASFVNANWMNGWSIENEAIPGVSNQVTLSIENKLSTDGNIGIGTTSPSEKLEVAGNARIVGNIYSKKVKVSATAGSWPDYVFENGYQLTPLSQLEAFVKTYKHLPEIPSAQEVEAKGQNLGEIQTTLLKKVEELTLYLIEESKEKEQLKRENQELKALFLQLNKEIKQLKKEIK